MSNATKRMERFVPEHPSDADKQAPSPPLAGPPQRPPGEALGGEEGPRASLKCQQVAPHLLVGAPLETLRRGTFLESPGVKMILQGTVSRTRCPHALPRPAGMSRMPRLPRLRGAAWPL